MSSGMRSFIRYKILILSMVCIFLYTNSTITNDRIIIKHIGSSPAVSGTLSYHTKNFFHFGDIDSDGVEEIIYHGVDKTNGFTSSSLYVSNIVGTQLVTKWKKRDTRGERLLVGNIDTDPQVEIILFCELDYNCASDESLRIIEWYKSSYIEREVGSELASLGTLLDINDDGINELVLVVEREMKYDEGRKWNPSTLKILSYIDHKFDVIYEFHLSYGIQAIAAGDIYGDGADELITIEGAAGDKSHIASYSVDPSRGISRIARKARVVDDVFFLNSFKNEYGSFIYVQQRGLGWSAILSLKCTEDKPECYFDNVYPIHPTVYADAIRSSWAYSKDRRKYLIGLGKREFMLHSDHQTK